MTIIAFIVQLTGATMLLLYAVRMVRTGMNAPLDHRFGNSSPPPVIR